MHLCAPTLKGGVGVLDIPKSMPMSVSLFCLRLEGRANGVLSTMHSSLGCCEVDAVHSSMLSTHIFICMHAPSPLPLYSALNDGSFLLHSWVPKLTTHKSLGFIVGYGVVNVDVPMSHQTFVDTMMIPLGKIHAHSTLT